MKVTRNYPLFTQGNKTEGKRKQILFLPQVSRTSSCKLFFSRTVFVKLQDNYWSRFLNQILAMGRTDEDKPTALVSAEIKTNKYLIK